MADTGQVGEEFYRRFAVLEHPTFPASNYHSLASNSNSADAVQSPWSISPKPRQINGLHQQKLFLRYRAKAPITTSSPSPASHEGAVDLGRKSPFHQLWISDDWPDPLVEDFSRLRAIFFLLLFLFCHTLREVFR